MNVFCVFWLISVQFGAIFFPLQIKSYINKCEILVMPQNFTQNTFMQTPSTSTTSVKVCVKLQEKKVGKHMNWRPNKRKSETIFLTKRKHYLQNIQRPSAWKWPWNCFTSRVKKSCFSLVSLAFHKFFFHLFLLVGG